MDLSDPFVLAQYHLTTPDIKRLSKQLRFWVYASIKGGMIMGEKRVGKTYAIKHIQQNIKKVLGRECYTFCVKWKAVDRFNEKKFWIRLLAATGFDTTLPGDADRLEQRFYDRIKILTEECGIPVCNAFIDEAQNVTVAEYLQLCHVFNELEDRGVRLYTWLVGQDELENVRTLMQEANCGQVIARFMQNVFTMRGITCARTLKSLLAQLDRMGVTESIAAKAVKKGFKLADMASDIWQAKCTVDKDHGRSPGTPWTMQQFQSVVSTMLQNIEKDNSAHVRLGQDDIQEIIELIQLETHYATDDDDDNDH